MTTLLYRCCECGEIIGDRDEPRVLTDFGWAHPVCAPDGDEVGA